MAKHLAEKDVEVVVSLLDGWNGKLTWTLLCEAYAKRTGHFTTRQTLCSHEQIATAYKVCKWGEGKVVKTPPSLAVAGEWIERLVSENERLKEQVRRYQEKFYIWIYNAEKRGVSSEMLNQALPKIDLGRTDL